MENVIDLLHDIEEKANQIIKRANEEKVKLQETLKNDLEKLDKEITDDTNAKLLVLKTQMDKDLSTEKQALIDDCNKQLSDMEKRFIQNHNSLVNGIIQQIVSE
ncbi:hypothetical protein acsn021_44960 [Anaerocolumna cellulosilytica]|uniref:Uncharacterized protein n=1 Tax=Anaerocolumna cellulosilytica TaxID=433286 RepID=A0A6S6R9V3_9FIRM|nr:hypothetical protein [Anaerocolumna cellulosilytica]MBB5195916.1 F0F1-type ATP synthase membrane subunit b/b' [Anaerocolumna cellulosilytica]BCJ96927.1 hypothetical protein acsn021_44960 [Anaerocolumna cellulosilytica]